MTEPGTRPRLGLGRVLGRRLHALDASVERARKRCDVEASGAVRDDEDRERSGSN